MNDTTKPAIDALRIILDVHEIDELARLREENERLRALIALVPRGTTPMNPIVVEDEVTAESILVE